MFTGIIGDVGTIESLTIGDAGGQVTIDAPTLAGSLAVSNSIAVNGCCLTVVSVESGRFSADLSGETVRKTTFGAGATGVRKGARVNLERPLTAGKEFGGHFVLGHVDTIGRVARLEPAGENWWYEVRVPDDFVSYVVPKGSITIDGVSLTVARWSDNVASVAVIPYTYEHTNIRDRKSGDAVNLEGDVLGKYVERHLAARAAASAENDSSLTIADLTKQGF